MKQDIRSLPNRRVMVSPSLLAADFANLEREIVRVEEAGADMLHLDVMDGHLVPNISFGVPVVAGIRKVTRLLFDTHLMIEHPIFYAAPFAAAGADHITFHIESKDDPLETIQAIRAAGCTVGISVKPGTCASALAPFLDLIDLVLVMSVEPGFGGQSFMHCQMDKVREVRQMIGKRNIQVEIDGGVDSATVEAACGAGANLLVAGTSVFRHASGAKAAIALLKNAQKVLDTSCPEN